jgi:hypothetical protein
VASYGEMVLANSLDRTLFGWSLITPRITSRATKVFVLMVKRFADQKLGIVNAETAPKRE